MIPPPANDRATAPPEPSQPEPTEQQKRAAREQRWAADAVKGPPPLPKRDITCTWGFKVAINCAGAQGRGSAKDEALLRLVRRLRDQGGSLTPAQQEALAALRSRRAAAAAAGPGGTATATAAAAAASNEAGGASADAGPAEEAEREAPRAPRVAPGVRTGGAGPRLAAIRNCGEGRQPTWTERGLSLRGPSGGRAKLLLARVRTTLHVAIDRRTAFGNPINGRLP